MLLNSDGVVDAEPATQSVPEVDHPEPADMATGEAKMSDENIISLLYSGLLLL